MSDPATLSVLLLTNHLTEQVEKSVSSAAWANEIIVGWTGEKDPTKEDHAALERIFPSIKVVRLPGAITDFAATRNQLHSRVTSDWIFWLDSDEVICTESISTIQSVLDQTQFNGAMVRRRDIFAGKALYWGEVRNVEIVRMFRKDFGSFIRPVHEVAVVEGEIARPGIVIEHYAHSSVSSFITKIIGYAQIEAALRYQKGRRTTSFEMVAWPTGKFLKNMFVNMAFLDGWQGITYALVMSLHSLAVRACLTELWQQQ